ncbi:MAG: hypothetical protein AB7S38_12580 [Vulcanimicrobiota bacterium]
MRLLAAFLALFLVACAPTEKVETPTVQPAQKTDFPLEFYPGAEVSQLVKNGRLAIAVLVTDDSPAQVREFYAQRLPGGPQTMEWTGDGVTWWLLFPKETPSPSQPSTHVRVGTGPRTTIQLRTNLPGPL